MNEGAVEIGYSENAQGAGEGDCGKGLKHCESSQLMETETLRDR